MLFYCLTYHYSLHSLQGVKTFLISLTRVLLLSLFCSGRVYAVVIKGLYEAEIPARAYSVGYNKAHMSAALRIVLVKLTGNSQISSRDGVAELLADADRYVRQFEYRTKEVSGTQQPVLWVEFNNALLDKSLQQANILKWGMERPSTLVWLAVNDVSGRRLSNDPEYVRLLEEWSQQRGIVLVYPLFDLEEGNRLSVSDVWGGFHDVVVTASRRYQANVIMSIRLELVYEGLWVVRWLAYFDDDLLFTETDDIAGLYDQGVVGDGQLLPGDLDHGDPISIRPIAMPVTEVIGKQAVSWITRGPSVAVALQDGIDILVDDLARRYGQVGSYKRDNIEMVVNGITDYDQYAKVLRYLESLNSVVSVEVRELQPNSVRYFLITEVDVKVIAETVSLGQTLEQTVGNSYRLIK